MQPYRRPKPGTLEPFDLYLRDIARIPLLSADEEREACIRVQEGDYAAFELLVVSNLRFVVNRAKVFCRSRRHVPFPDAIQEGSIGLIAGVRRYDLERGTRLLTYASYWINQAMYNASENYRLIRSPKGSIAHARRNLAEGRNTTAARAILEATKRANGTVSVEDLIPEGGRGSRVWESLSGCVFDSPLEDLCSAEDLVAVRRRLEELPDRMKTIIERRFGLNGEEEQTLDMIGQDLGVTKERVRQIEMQGLKRLAVMEVG